MNDKVSVPLDVTGELVTVNPVGADRPTLVTEPPVPVADSVPPAKLTPEPMVTLLNPPVPLPYRIADPVVAGAPPRVLYEMVLAAEPLKVVPDASPVPLLLNVTALTTEPADPVVFWFSVGTSKAWMPDMTTFVPLPRK